ncbi:MAG: hypothetical protein CVT99_12345 [Bacteroidetes bacterium HGW-Bacteroidetes-16]|jgi:hypothetical protein|nr:MAG: hypothetical protein CVT99_12345 [Bacteroidetes bacterium HGW-Bacteroidetes-16]
MAFYISEKWLFPSINDSSFYHCIDKFIRLIMENQVGNWFLLIPWYDPAMLIIGTDLSIAGIWSDKTILKC